MQRINDLDLRGKYISKYNIEEIFTEDMKQYMELVLFKKNEHICRESEDINYLFFFVAGKAKVYTTLRNGKSLLLCFYEDFRVLGDVELVNCEKTSSNIQVIEDSYCIAISLEKVRDKLTNDAKFLRFICNSLGDKLNRCSNNSSINLLYPLENRLSSYILVTGKRVEYKGRTKIEFQGNLTEISELLGASYRHLLRTLKTLSTKGILKKKGDYFEVIDEKNLANLASDLYK